MPEGATPDWLRRAPSVFVGLVLLATGTGKVLDLTGFASVIGAYDLVGPQAAWIVATTLPFVELGAGLGLLVGPRRPAALVAVGIHAMLVGVVVATLARGLEVENCGCFGVFLARPLGVSTLVEDLVMLVLSVLALLAARRGPVAPAATTSSK